MYGTIMDRCKAVETAKTVKYSIRDKKTGKVYKYGDNVYMDMCIANCVFVDCNSDIIKNPNNYFGFNRSAWDLITG